MFAERGHEMVRIVVQLAFVAVSVVAVSGMASSRLAPCYAWACIANCVPMDEADCDNLCAWYNDPEQGGHGSSECESFLYSQQAEPECAFISSNTCGLLNDDTMACLCSSDEYDPGGRD
jgi:hypothetical protein